jgi:hypothetical protein
MNPERSFEAEIEEKVQERPWGDMAVVADSDEEIDTMVTDMEEEEEPLPDTVREPRHSSSRSEVAARGSGPVA